MSVSSGSKRQLSGEETENSRSKRQLYSIEGSKDIDNERAVSSWVNLRCLVSSREASALIGKKGDNISHIRQITRVRCSFSENVKGATERVVTVGGPVDNVAQACGLLIRTMCNEPFDGPSTDKSAKCGLRTLIPHQAMGSIVGKAGSRLREIKEVSGVTLKVSETMLPLSTERSILLYGAADSVDKAVRMICRHLSDQAEKLATYHVQYYNPLPMYGTFGRANHWKLAIEKNVMSPDNPYGVSPTGYSAAEYDSQIASRQTPSILNAMANSNVTVTGANSDRDQTPEIGLQQPLQDSQADMLSQDGERSQRKMAPSTDATLNPVQNAQQLAQQATPGQSLTQQIYIPNDMVGAIIGKGGAKINEIRQLSGSSIKINEPQENSNERLVTITGTSESNQIALYMLYARLENEKHR
ncbi:hypothetical protein V1511DRAFT_495531 [Dipodascopsis uninucleata]